jgi:hypothetical protein
VSITSLITVQNAEYFLKRGIKHSMIEQVSGQSVQPDSPATQNQMSQSAIVQASFV